MRKKMPILVPVLLLAAVGCSIPKRHDASLLKKTDIPYVEEPAPAPSPDGSLWHDHALVGDIRANRVNDLVTLKISESTSAISKADTSTSRDGSHKLAAPALFGVTPDISVSTTTTNKFKGAGSTDRSATFTTTVTARVVKVLGNGNLIFEGFRDIQLNHETQRLYVAGMLDPRQLASDNSITSGQVAELRVGYGGKGVVDETTRPGFISRLLNFVWPL